MMINWQQRRRDSAKPMAYNEDDHSQKNSDDLSSGLYSAPNLADLEDVLRFARQDLLHIEVVAVIIGLGSNQAPYAHLTDVVESLKGYGKIKASPCYKNPDFTATQQQPKPDYVNQCVYLYLNHSMTLARLEELFARFENKSGRQRGERRPQSLQRVSLDIDILLVRADINSLSSQNIDQRFEWVVMRDRYPFKLHETVGLSALM